MFVLSPDISSVARDRCIHPLIIRAQELQTHGYNMMSFMIISGNISSVSTGPCMVSLSFTYLDLELQELHILNGIFKHCTDVDLCSIRNKVLQGPQSLVYPLSTFLQNAYYIQYMNMDAATLLQTQWESTGCCRKEGKVFV